MWTDLQREGIALAIFALTCLLALAMSANLGSVCTLVGNPQNMIIGQLSGLPFGRFTLELLPAAAAGSNLFSNVPFVLVAGQWLPHFADPPLMWKVMALATTFAGNLTLLGSVANLIVVESARGHLEVGFWDYARYGILVTLLTLAAGLGLLLAVAG